MYKPKNARDQPCKFTDEPKTRTTFFDPFLKQNDNLFIVASNIHYSGIPGITGRCRSLCHDRYEDSQSICAWQSSTMVTSGSKRGVLWQKYADCPQVPLAHLKPYTVINLHISHSKVSLHSHKPWHVVLFLAQSWLVTRVDIKFWLINSWQMPLL